MKKIKLFILLAFLLIITSCTSKEITSNNGLTITSIISSIGAANETQDQFQIQSFKYTITLTNNEKEDIKIETLTPVLTEGFSKIIYDNNVTLKINQIVKKNSSLNISGEIIFNAKGLEKKDIIGLKPFVKEVKIIQERVIRKSF